MINLDSTISTISIVIDLDKDHLPSRKFPLQLAQSYASEHKPAPSHQSLRTMADTWVVVGASRGIGLELVRQLLDGGKSVIAGARNPSGASELLRLKQSCPERCVVEQCDVTDEESINVGYHWPFGPGLLLTPSNRTLFLVSRRRCKRA